MDWYSWCYLTFCTVHPWPEAVCVFSYGWNLTSEILGRRNPMLRVSLSNLRCKKIKRLTERSNLVWFDLFLCPSFKPSGVPAHLWWFSLEVRLNYHTKCHTTACYFARAVVILHSALDIAPKGTKEEEKYNRPKTSQNFNECLGQRECLALDRLV